MDPGTMHAMPPAQQAVPEAAGQTWVTVVQAGNHTATATRNAESKRSLWEDRLIDIPSVLTEIVINTSVII